MSSLQGYTQFNGISNISVIIYPIFQYHMCPACPLCKLGPVGVPLWIISLRAHSESQPIRINQNDSHINFESWIVNNIKNGIPGTHRLWCREREWVSGARSSAKLSEKQVIFPQQLVEWMFQLLELFPESLRIRISITPLTPSQTGYKV